MCAHVQVSAHAQVCAHVEARGGTGYPSHHPHLILLIYWAVLGIKSRACVGPQGLCGTSSTVSKLRCLPCPFTLGFERASAIDLKLISLA